MEKLQVLEKALSRLPNRFTSNQLTMAIREMGYGHYIRKHNGFHEDLHRLGVHNLYARSKTWVKKNETTKNNPKPIIKNLNEQNEQQAINLLKELGYKILKPVQEFKEV